MEMNLVLGVKDHSHFVRNHKDFLFLIKIKINSFSFPLKIKK